MKVKYAIIVLFSLFFSKIYASNDSLKFSLNREVPLYYNSEYVDFTITMPDVLKNVDFPIACKLVIQDSVGNNIVEKLLYLEHAEFVSSIKVPDNIVSGRYILYCGILNDKFSNVNIYRSNIYFINIKTFKKRETGTSNRNDIGRYKGEFYNDPVAIKGVVAPINNNTLDNILVVMQSRGDMEIFEYTLVDNSGDFQFSNPFFGHNEIYFQIVGATDEDYSLQLIKFPYSLNKKTVRMQPFQLPTDYMIVDSLRNYVVEFNYLLADNDEQEYDHKKLIVYDKTIFVDDYIALPTTFDIVKEIVPLKKIRKQQLFLLNNASNSYFKTPPLFLIDGFIASSYQDILALDRDEIESFSMSYSSSANFSLMGRYARYGILSVTTKGKKHAPKSGKVYSFEGFTKSN